MTIYKIKQSFKLSLKLLLIAILAISTEIKANYVDVGTKNNSYNIEILFRATGNFFISAGKDFTGIGFGIRHNSFNYFAVYNVKTDYKLTVMYRNEKSEFEYQFTLQQRLDEKTVNPRLTIVYYMYDNLGFNIGLSDEVFLGVRRKF